MHRITVQIPIGENQSEMLRLETVDVDTARRIVDRLKGQYAEPVYACFGDEYERYLTIFGGLEGRYAVEYVEFGAGEPLLRPGADCSSNNDVQVADDECAFRPVEEIVDRDMAVTALVAFAQERAKPSSLNWLRRGGS